MVGRRRDGGAAKRSLQMLLSIGLLMACQPRGEFRCNQHDQCGPSGTCELDGFCSFPDDACPSGSRYGNYADERRAGECVMPRESASTSGAMTGGGDGTSSLEGGPGSGETSTTTSAATTLPSTSDTTTGGATTSGTTTAAESSGDTTSLPPERTSDGLLLLYLFDEGAGDTIFDRSDLLPALDLTLSGTGFSWTSDGLTTDGSGIALADAPPDKIADACMASNELTVEAWVTPAYENLVGPARILTYSQDTVSRNFLLGQGQTVDQGEGFAARVRISGSTDLNGMPELHANVAATTTATHLVYTRQSSGSEVFYVDGAPVATTVRSGDFSGWDGSYMLALGNEITLDRGFVGAIHLVAVYERALTPDEVEDNFAVGTMP